MLARGLKLLLGILLVPCCIAFTVTLVSLIGAAQAGASSAFPLAAAALVAGFLLWIVLFATLPRPLVTYVLAHELTHALWAWLMGGRVVRMNVRRDHGSVTLTKSNFLVTLAPYFFPLYTVLVVALYYGLSLMIEVEPYYLLWLGLVGFTWGFHFTFTLSTLAQHQSDIADTGWLFSYAVIYAGNVLGIGVWIVCVSSATFGQFALFLARDLAMVAGALWDGGAELVRMVRAP